MEPAGGVHRVKLRPHAMTDGVTVSLGRAFRSSRPNVRARPTSPSTAQWALVGVDARDPEMGKNEETLRRDRGGVHQCCGSPLEPKRCDAPRGQCTLGRRRSGAMLLNELEESIRGARFLWSYGPRGRLRGDVLRVVRQGSAAGTTGRRRRAARLRAERRAAAGGAWLSGAPRRTGLLRNEQRQMAVAAAHRRGSGRRAVL